MCSGWCNNLVTEQHARCNNENKYQDKLLEQLESLPVNRFMKVLYQFKPKSRDLILFIPSIKLNSVALFSTRTIPTERPPPVGEVSANFCG